ncbi:hypothetical protein G7Y89_g10385 [Cudoniella acicularis]|uniref:Uncharacterized protein n=1 Tax=Cudoniella acicularis TaxID=354080 RepID=A0A8H4RCX4_9HELO|nr:hypothetical protein G7Y89_g10385 [Cudoniella acicularis]
MIRQRVDCHGKIYDLEPASELPGCKLSPSEIGVIKEGPVKKWMAAKREWDTKFASVKRKIQKTRAREMAKGYQQFSDGEVPPPSALAGRRKAGENLLEEKKKRSTGMSLWALWGSKHDEKTIEKEYDGEPETSVATAADGAGARALHDKETTKGKLMERPPPGSRSRSRRRAVTDEHQADMPSDIDENTSTADLLALKQRRQGESSDGHLLPNFMASESQPQPEILVHSPTNEGDDFDRKRPKAGGIAFPFSLAGHKASASMTTLASNSGVSPVEEVRVSEVRVSEVRESGLQGDGEDDNISDANGSISDAQKVNEDTNGIESRGKGKENGDMVLPESKGKAVENGEVVSAQRPPLESFVTAMEVLPSTPDT